MAEKTKKTETTTQKTKEQGEETSQKTVEEAPTSGKQAETSPPVEQPADTKTAAKAESKAEEDVVVETAEDMAPPAAKADTAATKPTSSPEKKAAPAAKPASTFRIDGTLIPPEHSPLTNDDLYYFNEGTHGVMYDKFGSKVMNLGGTEGTYFAVWAPNASQVFVIGDFNDWNKTSHPLHVRGSSGVWEGFLTDAKPGSIYKYHIISQVNNYRAEKADPFAFHAEVPPRTGSVVWEIDDYEWNDQEWMKERKTRNSLESPMSIYEVHFGSWRRVPEEDHRYLNYREMAPLLAEYVLQMGFTHVEFMPIKEHPFYGSWGYQVTGYYAPTSRYGTPQDLMYLVDYLHQQGIGVILDWVPSHFPVDGHGLGFFDGTHLYEHAYPQKGWHPDWNSFIFNYGRHEVRSFLLSSAIYWLDKYHIDGLRVDAVASMLYLDYSRREGEWMPNQYGGRENIEAISFLRQVNEQVYTRFPDVQTIAEESTDWSMVSRPTYVGGLGFGMKWDMGWMHDTLMYMSRDPIYRKYHHNEMTFRMIYAFTENFALPLSHDEVVHGKGSLLSKMPGDLWQKFANLRLLYAYMYAQPGKKLLFMGAEIGQWREWYHEESLEWHLLQFAPHSGLQQWVADLNTFYRETPPMYELDHVPEGFRWIDCNDWENSMLVMLRRGEHTDKVVVAVFNFTPVPRHQYRVGVPFGGFWKEALNSDAKEYEGSGVGNMGGIEAEEFSSHGFHFSLKMSVPPLGAVFLLGEGPSDW
jgi:1,4-alpha-glucan branching enzyme